MGVSLDAGRRRTVKTQHIRIASFKLRKDRFYQLRRAGIDTARLLRTSDTAAMEYGHDVTGVSNQVFRTQRQAAAACLVTRPGGGDLDLTI